MSYDDLHPNIIPTVKMVDAMFDEVYLVGGALRDSLLGKQTLDLDFTTSTSPDEIERILKRNPALSVRTEAKQYGTLSVHAGMYDIQITSYRSEKYDNKSHLPTITLLKDIDSDLSRRDFTINAMALSRDEFVDPYNGKVDLDNKVIKSVGDPRNRFLEDPLRIIRAFRFVSQLGYTIESSCLDAAIASKELISKLSAERIANEFNKAMSGHYWADCLNECIDSGIFNEIMKRLSLPYHPSINDFEYEFNNYSTSEFETMSYSARWAYLIKILHYSEKDSGVTSTNIESTAQNVIQHFFLNKKIKDEIIELITVSRIHDGNIEFSLEAMRMLVEKYKQNDDKRYMIEEGKYLTLKGRKEMENSNYGLAKNYFLRAIDVTEDNYKFILEDRNEDRKNTRLRGISSYYKTRIKHLITTLILEEKLYQKYSSTKSIRSILSKKLRFNYMNQKSLMEQIDQAIAYIYRLPLHNISLEPFIVFLDNSSNSLNESQILRYKRQYIDKEMRSKKLSPEERADLYLKKAELVTVSQGTPEDSMEYLDPYMDYLYNKMLQQEQLNDFKQHLKKYEKYGEKFMILSDKEHRHWMGRRKISLSTASALIHALSLAQKLADKIGISNRIVQEYDMAGYGYEKNKLRYQIYVDWFNIVHSLDNTSSSGNNLIDLEEKIKKTTSISYVDPDEEYLISERNDLVQKRQLLKDIHEVIKLFTGLSNYAINDKIIFSIAQLYGLELINIQTAFHALKNYIFSIEDRQLITEKIEILPEEIINDYVEELDQYLIGESETLEYKSSWQFDVKLYKHTGNVKNDISLIDAAVKDIAGFMNKNGGILLVGIEDDMNVLGLENTDFLLESNPNHIKKLDNIQMKIRDGIVSRLGPMALSNSSITVEKYKDKSVIKIVALASHMSPIIYKDNDNEYYYVRSGTSTTNAGLQAAIERTKSQRLITEPPIIVQSQSISENFANQIRKLDN